MTLKRISLRIPKPFQLLLFSALATSWVSGITFFILNRFITIDGDFGPQKHPWQFPMISIHGFAAFSMMILFGAMVASHVPLAWRTNKQRLWGLSFIIATSIQIITGYTLYYLATEMSRDVTAYIHLSIGFLLPAILAIHVLEASKSRKVKNKAH